MTQGSVFFSSPTQQDGIEASPYGAEWNTGIGIIDSPVFRYRSIPLRFLELDTEKSGGGTEVHREEIFFFLRGVCLGLK